MAQLVKNPPAMRETWVRSLGWEDLLEYGTATPLQDSGLENSIDCIVRGVTKSPTGLRDFHFHFHVIAVHLFSHAVRQGVNNRNEKETSPQRRK